MRQRRCHRSRDVARFATLEVCVERRVVKWDSPRLDREMGMAIYGNTGKPVLFFPTGGGDFLDCERFRMVDALAPLINAGRIKLYSVDSVSRWSWIDQNCEPKQKIEIQAAYDDYLVNELLPFIKHDSSDTTQRFAATGASIGAYLAYAAVARHPDWFDLMCAMSGTYQMDRRLKGYWDPTWYLHDPTQFLPNLPDDHPHLALLHEAFFVLGLGRHYENDTYTKNASWALSRRGIPHRVEQWGGQSGHDWPTWRTMLPLFLNRLA